MSEAETVPTSEVAELRRRLAELEDALTAVAAGEADGLVVGAPGAERVVTVSGVDLPYRVMVEQLGDGAATLDRDGAVLVANRPFARLLGVDVASLRGWPVSAFVLPEESGALTRLLEVEVGDSDRAEVHLQVGGRTHHVLLTTTAIRVAQETVVCCAVTDVTDHRETQAELEAERQRAAQRDDRLRTALELNDTIVQGLVTAELSMDLGQHPRARRLLAATSVRARALIGELTGDDVRPGMLRRERAASLDREEQR